MKSVLDLYKHLDQSCKSVGEQFQTPSGSVITIVGWDRKSFSGLSKKLTCHCSVCSKDKQLWGESETTTTIGKLRGGLYPCGCAKLIKWTESQNLLRVQRLCLEVGYTFHGWAEKYKGLHTKLSLENYETGNKWETCSIDAFLSGKRDPSLRALVCGNNFRIADEVHIKDFFEIGNFLEGTKFTRGEGNTWKYSCPKCSNDEYVKAGVCCGMFTSTIGNLKKGQKSCRCSKHYRWTKEQLEYRINKSCEEKGFIFRCWTEEFKGVTTRLSWECSKGHKHTTPVRRFLLVESCNKCQPNISAGNGYYPSRKYEEDYLYIMSTPKWFKCGRSFEPEKRRSKIAKDCGCCVSLDKIYAGTHQEVFDLEQQIKNLMYKKGLNFYVGDGFTSVWEGSTECYKMEALKLTENIIENSLLKGV